MAEPIVTVWQGKLKGKVGVDYKGGQYYSFQGIPYGKPPVGDLRFKAPLPADSWEGVRDATTEGSECISKHMVFFHTIGSEDCLSLNVYTKQLPEQGSKPKPVMVWVHGGGFMYGSSKTEIYGPEFLITEDIVLVTINYRIGMLGFLSINDPTLNVPGNAGLKDMVLALKWVQKNINQFSGDPHNVTLFGESAGSAAVHYLKLSPLTKGLFHRVIMQSGSTLNPWASGNVSAAEIAKVLGYDGKDDMKLVLDFLRSQPPEKLLEAQEKIGDAMFVNEERSFCPVIENPHPEAFISEHPIDMMLSGNYNKVPVMMGYTDREGMLVELMHKKAFETVEYRLRNFEKSIPKHYNVKQGSELSNNIAKKIEEFYYKDAKTPEDETDIFYILNSDTFFVRGIYTTLKALLKTMDHPIYFYRFTADTELNLYKKIGNIKGKGAAHADDLGYLFKTILTAEINPGSTEDILISRMVKMWTNFARNSNPNSKEQDSVINVVWPPVTKDQYKCLDIGTELKVINDPDIERMRFWDSISSMKEINSKL